MLGKRDGGAPPDRRLPMAFVRLGGHRHVRPGHLRPAVDRRGRPDGGGARQGWPRPSSSSRSWACPYYCFHDRDVAPEGATFAESSANLDAIVDEAAAHQERTGVTPAVGHRQPVQPSTLRGRRRHQPRPGGLRLRRGAGAADARASPSGWAARTTRCGAAARATRPCSTPISVARAGSSRGSCTWWPSTSTRSASRARCSSSPSRWSRPSTSTTTTRATVHGFLVRNGLEDEYRVNIEANHATLAGHSFHHEVAYAVANGIFGSIDANRGDYQNGWDTDQFPNSVEELSLARLRDPARRRLHHRRLQLRRQAAPPEHGPGRPLPRPHRRHRHARPVAPGGGRDARGGAPRGAPRGALRRLGGRARQRRSSTATRPSSRSPTRVAAGEIDPRPVSGRQERLENIVNEHIWAVDRAGRAAPTGG